MVIANIIVLVANIVALVFIYIKLFAPTDTPVEQEQPEPTKPEPQQQPEKEISPYEFAEMIMKGKVDIEDELRK